jgi:hypothetical protein
MKKFRKKRGPKPPDGGRIRITVNLPMKLMPPIRQQPGSSLSDRIVGIVQRYLDSTEGNDCVDTEPNNEPGHLDS